MKFFAFAFATYGVLYALIEPLGLFGLGDYTERLGIWGYLILTLPSILLAYCIVYLRSHLGIVRAKLLPPLEIQRVPSAATSPLFWDKYQIVRDLYDEHLSRLQEVRNKFDGKAYLLKTIKQKSSYNPDVMHMIQEAYQGNSLRSRVALPIEILEDENYFYEILPYFKGDTLYQLMSVNTMGVRGALLELWTKDLLELVQPLHEFSPKIVHRDINPNNVLVSSDDLRLVLIDLSSAVTEGTGKSFAPIGNPAFTSPEQRTRIYKTNSDVYSIGALLYYLNTKTWPPTIEDRQYRGSSIELKPPIRKRLDIAIHKMFALDPSERFKDATEALDFVNHRLSTELLSLDSVGTLQFPGGKRIIMSRHDWRVI